MNVFDKMPLQENSICLDVTNGYRIVLRY